MDISCNLILYWKWKRIAVWVQNGCVGWWRAVAAVIAQHHDSITPHITSPGKAQIQSNGFCLMHTALAPPWSWKIISQTTRSQRESVFYSFLWSNNISSYGQTRVLDPFITPVPLWAEIRCSEWKVNFQMHTSTWADMCLLPWGAEHQWVSAETWPDSHLSPAFVLSLISWPVLFWLISPKTLLLWSHFYGTP